MCVLVVVVVVVVVVVRLTSKTVAKNGFEREVVSLDWIVFDVCYRNYGKGDLDQHGSLAAIRIWTGHLSMTRLLLLTLPMVICSKYWGCCGCCWGCCWGCWGCFCDSFLSFFSSLWPPFSLYHCHSCEFVSVAFASNQTPIPRVGCFLSSV